MRPDWKNMKRTIIVHADDLEVKSAPSTHSRSKSPHRGKNTIRIHQIHYKSSIIGAILLGILSIFTFALAAIAFIFYKISRKK